MGYLVFHFGIPTAMALEAQLSLHFSSYFVRSAVGANLPEKADLLSELEARVSPVIH